jgi:hypothetical protein
MKTSPTKAGEGNYPFPKYAFEGEMVKSWVLKFMGDTGIKSLYLYAMKSPTLRGSRSRISSDPCRAWFCHDS